MIRATDIANAALWPMRAAPARAGARDAANWFDDGAGPHARISGDLSPAARGLTVEQHAGLVLAHLRGDADAI